MHGHSRHESWTQEFAVEDLHSSKRAVVFFALTDLLAISITFDASAKRRWVCQYSVLNIGRAHRPAPFHHFRLYPPIPGTRSLLAFVCPPENNWLSGHPSFGRVIIRYGRMFSLHYTVLMVASTRSRVLGFIVTVVPKYCRARTEEKRGRGDRCSIYRVALPGSNTAVSNAGPPAALVLPQRLSLSTLDRSWKLSGPPGRRGETAFPIQLHSIDKDCGAPCGSPPRRSTRIRSIDA